MANARLEAEITVPTGTTVSASNSGGGPTSVTVTPGSVFITDLCSALGTALTAQRSPTVGAWTVSVSPTDGTIVVSCDNSTTAIPSFSLDWTSTDLRDLLGFEYNINYPITASELARQIGYGTWTSASVWLCNEASGSLAPALGATSLTAVSTPTYSNQGPRGGADKAIGFDSAADAFSGGDIHDSTGTDDLIIAWVGKFSAVGADVALVTKRGAGNGWILQARAAGGIRFETYDGVLFPRAETSAAGYYAAEWHVGIAVLDRAANAVRVGTRGLTSLTTTISSAVSATGLGTIANADNMLVGAATFGNAPTNFQCAYLAIVSGASVATGLSAGLSTALTNFAASLGPQHTGTRSAKGIWYPGGPLNADSDPKQSPTGDNKSASVSPLGRVYSMASSEYFRHRNVRFEKVANTRIWENDATTPGQTWESFYLETQLGHHSWFDIGSRVRVYWNNAGTATELGNGDVDAWYMPSCVRLDDLQLSTKTWTGLVDVTLGDLFSDG